MCEREYVSVCKRAWVLCARLCECVCECVRVCGGVSVRVGVSVCECAVCACV